MSRPSTITSAPSAVVRATPMVAEVATARSTRAIAAGSLRRFAGWLSTLLADDGMNARFSAERQRDAGIVRHVERRNGPWR